MAVMAEPTLIHIFGAGATQDANTITIQKSALAAMGLTLSASNRAESIFAALIKLNLNSLSITNAAMRPEQSITVQQGFDSIETNAGVTYYNTSILVNLRKTIQAGGITPDAY